MVVAKTDQAHLALQQQIQKRTAERRYLALVWGATKFEEAVVDAPIGRHPTDRKKMAVIRDTERYTARKAVTRLSVVERLGVFTLIEARLDTGRTHQIRVHCAFVGHPVVGDPTYGGANRVIPSEVGKTDQRELSRLMEDLRGQALHAFSLSFDHPVNGERLSFQAPLPRDFESILAWLRGRRLA
jgi:23S rRNA pseudouridine1911/1915/1917 synthase